jgi:hypothetical protein
MTDTKFEEAIARVEKWLAGYDYIDPSIDRDLRYILSEAYNYYGYWLDQD